MKFFHAALALVSLAVASQAAEDCSGNDVPTEVCEIPPQAKDFCVVTFEDAHIGAHSMYTGLAIGGTLYDATSSQDGTIDRTQSYIKKLNEPNRFNFNFGAPVLGTSCASDSLQARMEYIARTAKDFNKNGYLVKVFTEGGPNKPYTTFSFRNGGQGYDKGKTLAIFNTSDDIYIKGVSGRQFGPTIIAPFSKVIVEPDAGFVDGSIYAKSLEAKEGSLQLHGDTYSGPLSCGTSTNPTGSGGGGGGGGGESEDEPPSGGNCKKEWEQCGGQNYNGATCCEAGTSCVFDSQWWSACKPGGPTNPPQPAPTNPPQPDPPSGGNCKKEWEQCGGQDYNGPTCCEAGTSCVFDNEWWSACKPGAPTNPPQPAPTDPPAQPKSNPTESPKGSGSGDPHFKTWTGEKFDYHGECDLVLLDNPSFGNGKGMRVHIRTTQVKYFSYIEKVALQIGGDVLEFDNDVENFLINGEKVEPNRQHHKTMFAGYVVRRDKKAISVRLEEEGKAKIDFHTRKNGFPAVIVDAGNTSIFEGSLGMLGEWKTGRKLARDGITEIEVDPENGEAFGLEWQVRDTEPMLFKESRFPRFPEVCVPPKKLTRLGMAKAKAEAEEACNHWKMDKDDCIFDVIATRDVFVAEEGHIVHVE